MKTTASIRENKSHGKKVESWRKLFCELGAGAFNKLSVEILHESPATVNSAQEWFYRLRAHIVVSHMSNDTLNKALIGLHPKFKESIDLRLIQTPNAKYGRTVSIYYTEYPKHPLRLSEYITDEQFQRLSPSSMTFVSSIRYANVETLWYLLWTAY